MNSNTGRHTGKTGFTLTEIMIVVSIIGLLAVIAVPSFRVVVNNSRQKQVAQDLLLLHGCLDKLAWDTGSFPGTSYSKAPLRTYYTGGGVWPPHVYSLTNSNAGLVSTDGSYKNWKGPYIGLDRMPVKDPWGSVYWFDPQHYKFNDGGNHCYAAVISSGPDRLMYNNDDLYEIIQTYY